MKCHPTLGALASGLLLLLIAATAGAATPPAGPIEQAAEQNIANVRDTIVDAIWMKSDEYGHAGDRPNAVALARIVIALDPHYVEAYGVAAYLSMQMGQRDQAAAIWRAGMAANPQDYELPLEMAHFYYMYGGKQTFNMDQALALLKKAAELDSPLRVKAAYAHGLEKAKQYQEAAREWHKILKLDPNDKLSQRALKKLRDQGKIGPED